jgi:hypothetical protein
MGGDARAIEVIDGKPRKQAKGRADYTTQPFDGRSSTPRPKMFPPSSGFVLAKLYAYCRRVNLAP